MAVTSAHGTTCKPAEPCNRIGFLRSKLACGAENRCGYGASSPHEQKEPRSGEFANAALQEKKEGASSPHEQKEPRSGEFANAALQEKKDGEQPT
ncbi:MAG: hypothetical protein PUF42_01260 [Firmicutes bacterium]|nr:hypothetical protein [Bacillota bacterium]